MTMGWGSGGAHSSRVPAHDHNTYSNPLNMFIRKLLLPNDVRVDFDLMFFVFVNPRLLFFGSFGKWQISGSGFYFWSLNVVIYHFYGALDGFYGNEESNECDNYRFRFSHSESL